MQRQAFFYYAGRTAVALAARTWFALNIEQQAPLLAGPKIIAPNHPTTTDPFLILTIAREPITILISETLFKVRGFGRYLRTAGHVEVIQRDGRSAFDAAQQLLAAGRTVAVFPEGAISPAQGGLCRGHTGAVRLALLTGTPIIPVGIGLLRDRIRLINTRVAGKPEVGTWYFGGPYAMTVGAPLRFEGERDDRAAVRTMTDRLMSRIAQLAQHSDRRLLATRLAFQSIEFNIYSQAMSLRTC
jgi:1-acyl-sn-glycerol-3-phosphate acyltransferase